MLNLAIIGQILYKYVRILVFSSFRGKFLKWRETIDLLPLAWNFGPAFSAKSFLTYRFLNFLGANNAAFFAFILHPSVS